MFKNKKAKFVKGFTLIELLVVIAIIGILSSVVLASLNTARSRGNNAKIKAQLSGLRASAELYYDSTGGYSVASNCTTGMFADTTSGMSQYSAVANYPGASGLACFSTATTYTVSYPLASQEGTFTHWCVDDKGSSKGRTSAVTSAGGC